MLRDTNEPTKTIRVKSETSPQVFYIQLNGDKAPQLIAEAHQEWWAWLYKDLLASEDLIQSQKPEEFLRKIRIKNPDSSYLQWLENISTEGMFIPGYWTIFYTVPLLEVMT